ncbi:MAG: DUF1059 domain-containing protein [Methanoregula sp.]
MQRLFSRSPERPGEVEMEPLSLAPVKCSDLAVDCPVEPEGTSERELIRQLIEYTKSSHNTPVLTADTPYRLRNRIKK